MSLVTSILPNVSIITGPPSESSATCESEPLRQAAIISTQQPDRHGINHQIDRILASLRVSTEAATSVSISGWYQGQLLVSGSRPALLKIPFRISEELPLSTVRMEVFELSGVWTVSHIAPMATDVRSGMLSLVSAARINIVWETAPQRHAPDTGIECLHQDMVLKLPRRMSLATFEQIMGEAECQYGGTIISMPGICLPENHRRA